MGKVAETQMDFGIEDIDMQLEKALLALEGEKIDLSVDTTLDEASQQNEERARILAGIKADKDREAAVSMSQAKAFGKTLMHGDGRNAKAPSRISNRITSKIG